MIDREDCFAYRNGKCNALSEYMVKSCEGCKFYKTIEKAAIDRKHSIDLINAIENEELKNHIIQKYYYGNLGGRHERT